MIQLAKLFVNDLVTYDLREWSSDLTYPSLI